MHMNVRIYIAFQYLHRSGDCSIHVSELLYLVRKLIVCCFVRLLSMAPNAVKNRPYSLVLFCIHETTVVGIRLTCLELFQCWKSRALRLDHSIFLFLHLLFERLLFRSKHVESRDARWS